MVTITKWVIRVARPKELRGPGTIYGEKTSIDIQSMKDKGARHRQQKDLEKLNAGHFELTNTSLNTLSIEDKEARPQEHRGPENMNGGNREGSNRSLTNALMEDKVAITKKHRRPENMNGDNREGSNTSLTNALMEDKVAITKKHSGPENMSDGNREGSNTSLTNALMEDKVAITKKHRGPENIKGGKRMGSNTSRTNALMEDKGAITKKHRGPEKVNEEHWNISNIGIEITPMGDKWARHKTQRGSGTVYDGHQEKTYAGINIPSVEHNGATLIEPSGQGKANGGYRERIITRINILAMEDKGDISDVNRGPEKANGGYRDLPNTGMYIHSKKDTAAIHKEQRESRKATDGHRDITSTRINIPPINENGARPKEKKGQRKVNGGHGERTTKSINIAPMEDTGCKSKCQSGPGKFKCANRERTSTYTNQTRNEVPITDELITRLSVRLYNVLDRVGASAEFRKFRQNCSISQEIIETIRILYLVRQLSTSYIFGSSSEGTTTLGLNSDVDALTCHDVYPVIDSLSEAGHGHVFLMVRDRHTQPGYVKLQRVDNKHPLTGYLRDMNRDVEESDCEGRICIKHVTLVDENNRLDERNGPADTSTMINTDYVAACRCSKIPEFCREWIERKRYHKWPSKHMLDNMSTMGCFVVGVGHPTSIERNIEWRLSFSLQEREMMFSMNLVQHKCYIVLKMIKKDLIEPIIGKSISSYHLKTCMFHTMENTKSNIWKPRYLVQCVLLCISVLLKWVYKGYCPNYFIKEENMFDREIHRNQRLHLIRQIHVLLSSGYGFLFLIKRDKVGVCLKDNSPINIQIELELSKANILLGKKLELIHGVFVFKKNLCNEANSEKSATHFMNMVLGHMFNTKSVINHIEQQTQEAMAYIKPFVHLQLAQSFASLAFNTHTLESNYSLLEKYGYHLREGSHCDLTGSRFLEATVLFKLEQYKRCISILDQEEMMIRLPFCICNKTFNRAFTSEQLIQLSRLSVPSIMSRTSCCVTFLRSDISIIPEALQYEMYRSINTPSRSRHYVHDTWFDLVVVDPVIYLHFLQYLANAKLNKTYHKLLAITKLESEMQSNKILGHRETGYNLLGWIYFNEGCIHQGMRYFKKSWSIRPHHNAAKLHIMKFIRDRNCH